MPDTTSEPIETPEGQHPRVVNALAETMGETLGSIGEANRDDNDAALASCEKAISGAEEALRLLRSMRALLVERTTPATKL